MSSQDGLGQVEQLESDLKRKTRELNVLKEITSRIQGSNDHEENFNFILTLLDKHFDFRHSMILVPDRKGMDLSVISSHGYAETGIGARVKIGEGIIGTVAKRKKSLRMPNVNVQIAYMMVAKKDDLGEDEEVEIKLPGLQNPKSSIAIPLLIEDELVGVLNVESERLNLFQPEDENLITEVANHLAISLNNSRLQEGRDQHLQEIKRLEEKIQRKRLESKILSEISTKIRSSLDLNFTLSTLLELLDRNFGFKYSMVLLAEPQSNHLSVFASYGYETSGVGAQVKIGDGIIGTVAKRKKIMRLGSINMQMRYLQAGKSKKDKATDDLNIKLPGLQQPGSQVAIPLLLQEELVGVLSVESEDANIFKDEDEDLISLLASQAALAIQNARHFETEKKKAEEIQAINKTLADLNQEQQRTLNLFVKYVPEPVVQKALSDQPDEIFQGEQLNIAVLFCDIRNFTPLSEVLEPKQVVYLLNTYYAQMDEIIKKYDGVVNQYVGDEIFVTFGAPVSIKQPRKKSVWCALEMIAQLKNINQEIQPHLEAGIEVGIGINYGPVVAGNLGSKERIEYSVTGDTVNTAKRIESLTKTCPNSVLVSETVYEKVKGQVKCKAWDPLKVKGKDQLIQVYQVSDLDSKA